MERKVALYQDDTEIGKPREHLVGFPIPTEILEEFYLILNLDAPIYACLVVDENNKSKIFIETNDGRTDIFRVFWRQSDIKIYVSSVKTMVPESIKKVLVWETTKDKIVKVLKTSLDEEHELNKVDVICTAVIKGELRDIELFWSSCNLNKT